MKNTVSGSKEIQPEIYKKRLKQINTLTDLWNKQLASLSVDNRIDVQRMAALKKARSDFLKTIIDEEKQNTEFLRLVLNMGRSKERTYVNSLDGLKAEVRKGNPVCVWIDNYLLYVGIDDQGHLTDLSEGKITEQQLESYLLGLKMFCLPDAEVWDFVPFINEEEK